MEDIDIDIKEALDRYVQHRIPPGGFLRAVLENDLMGAMGRADVINRENIFKICKYIYNELPGDTHGSPKIVKDYLENN